VSKAAKRQRKKDQRRQRLEAEIRDARNKRRRRLTINLAIVGLVVAGISVLVTSQRQETPKEEEEKCEVSEQPTDAAAEKIALPEFNIDKSKTYAATIETSEGPIVVDLDVETAPCTVNSFVYLARQGFFDGLTFHRIVLGFAIQGGDPKGDGSGGPGYQVVEAPPANTQYPKGTVAMAKAGSDPAGASGSQFFIVPGDGAATLNGTPAQPALYALLGRVTEGLEVLVKIEARPRNGERPVDPISIVTITVKEAAKSR
jgi:cyclophilin family peptidyl-prolyl cis-trans isomerase